MSRSGLSKWSGAVACAGAMLVGAGGAEVSATPLTPFRYEAQAQRHCPHDRVVWLDFRKGVYYRKGQKRYGQGFDGSFVCLSEARAASIAAHCWVCAERHVIQACRRAGYFCAGSLIGTCWQVLMIRGLPSG